MLKEYEILDNALVASRNGNGRVSVYINPDAEERQSLLSSLNIDQHTLSSTLDPDEVSRIEFGTDYVFLIWKRPDNCSFQEQILFSVSSIGLFLREDRIAIIGTDDIPLVNERQPRRIESTLDIMLNLLYQTIHHYLGHLKVIKQVSREIQQKINTALENEYLIQMFSLGESLTYYLHAISSNDIVLKRLRNSVEKIGFSPRQIEFLDDIIIENNQAYRQAEIYSNILSGLMDARGTLVNNNMNVLMKNLTIINVVFLPLNLIASIGGMSEYTMMTQGMKWYVSYSLFAAAMVLVGFLTVLFINRFNWWKNGNAQRAR